MFKNMRRRKGAKKTVASELAPTPTPPAPGAVIMSPSGVPAQATLPANFVEQLGAQFIASTALATVQADVHTLVRRFNEHLEHMAALNTALGDFRNHLVVPLREELKHLRYNTGARVEQTTSELDVIVAHLDKLMTPLLRAQGWSDERIAQYREEHGLVMREAPRAVEFAEYRESVEKIRDELGAQNARLLEEVRTLREANEALAAQNRKLSKQPDGERAHDN